MERTDEEKLARATKLHAALCPCGRTRTPSRCSITLNSAWIEYAELVTEDLDDYIAAELAR